MGCPMAKVNGQGGGARLLCDADNASRLVEKIVAAVRIPVTVKMRLGWDETSRNAADLARRAEAEGVDSEVIVKRILEQIEVP